MPTNYYPPTRYRVEYTDALTGTPCALTYTDTDATAQGWDAREEHMGDIGTTTLDLATAAAKARRDRRIEEFHARAERAARRLSEPA